jgi:magnesium chelatase family protein
MRHLSDSVLEDAASADGSLSVQCKKVRGITVARSYGLVVGDSTSWVVTVEAEVTPGLPETILVGLPDTALRETRDRIRAAIVNSGQTWPSAKLTIGISPAWVPAKISSLDLAIAVAVLAAAGDVPEDKLSRTLFVAELGLDGWVRPAQDVLTDIRETGLPAALADDSWALVVSFEDEASIEEFANTSLEGVLVLTAGHLRDVVTSLR